MIVVCPSCSARFQYDEARFQGARSKRFRCPKCAHIFEAENPSYAPAPTAIFDGAAFAAKLAQHQVDLPPVQIEPPSPPEEPPLSSPPDSAQETAARHDREAMLAAAGVGGGSLHGVRISLAFLNGPQASMVKVLNSFQTVIGREDGDIVTKDPETSRRHAMLEIHSDGSVWLSDLGSTNGTFLDGIQVFGTIQVTDRQEFSCGKSTFMLLIRREDTLSMD